LGQSRHRTSGGTADAEFPHSFYPQVILTSCQQPADQQAERASSKDDPERIRFVAQQQNRGQRCDRYTNSGMNAGASDTPGGRSQRCRIVVPGSGVLKPMRQTMDDRPQTMEDRR